MCECVCVVCLFVCFVLFFVVVGVLLLLLLFWGGLVVRLFFVGLCVYVCVCSCCCFVFVFVLFFSCCFLLGIGLFLFCFCCCFRGDDVAVHPTLFCRGREVGGIAVYPPLSCSPGGLGRGEESSAQNADLEASGARWLHASCSDHWSAVLSSLPQLVYIAASKTDNNLSVFCSCRKRDWREQTSTRCSRLGLVMT